MVEALISWPAFVAALVVFGFAPGALLRLIALAFPRDDPRRRELRAELHAVPRVERPFWVVEQLEVALFEGIWGRVRSRAARARSNWRTASDLRQARLHRGRQAELHHGLALVVQTLHSGVALSHRALVHAREQLLSEGRDYAPIDSALSFIDELGAGVSAVDLRNAEADPLLHGEPRLGTWISGSLRKRRARRLADRRLDEFRAQLLAALSSIDCTSLDAEAIREAAAPTTARVRLARIRKPTLIATVDTALGSPRGSERRERIGCSVDSSIALARLRRVKYARAISDLVSEVAREATVHGSGDLHCRCSVHGDRIQLLLTNRMSPGLPDAGWGLGGELIARLADSLPGGRLDYRGAVGSAMATGRHGRRQFGVQVSFSRDALIVP